MEIEFAVNLSVPAGARAEFAFLQLRPLALSRELEELDVCGRRWGAPPSAGAARALGNGRIEGVTISSSSTFTGSSAGAVSRPPRRSRA